MTGSRTSLAIGSPAAGETKWLLEVFDVVGSLADLLAGFEGVSSGRHAVWLVEHGGRWRWWCCCGARVDPAADLVQVLTTARMHFDAFPAQCSVSVSHPIAMWPGRVVGRPAEDDRAVAELVQTLNDHPREGFASGAMPRADR